MRYNTFLKQFKQLKEQTTRYVPPNRVDYQDNYDRYVDFPYVEDPTGFITHRPLEQNSPVGYKDEVKEQSAKERNIGSPPHTTSKLAFEQEAPKEPTINPEEAGEEAGANVGAEMGADMGAEMGAEAGADMGGMGANMGGIGGMGGPEEEPLSSSQIGRVYELKKIYSRLASVESYLSRAGNEQILQLRQYVAKAIDLFEVVMSNFDQYKDKIDEIIVQYYEFLEIVFETIKKYYKSVEDFKELKK